MYAGDVERSSLSPHQLVLRRRVSRVPHIAWIGIVNDGGMMSVRFRIRGVLYEYFVDAVAAYKAEVMARYSPAKALNYIKGLPGVEWFKEQ